MKKNYLLGLSTAFLAWLAWPPIPYTSIVLLVAFVPLLMAIERIIISDAQKKGGRVFGLAFLTFLIWNTSCIYWVFNSLNAVMPLPLAIFVSLIPFGLGACLMTIAIWLYYRLRLVTNRFISALGLVGFWLSYEYLHQSWDLAFPWMTLGNGFSNFHQIIQWYEFTGVYGGSLWIWVVNLMLFEIILQKSSGRRDSNFKKLIVSVAGIVVIPMLYSITIYTNYKEKINPANVVVVQPNIDPYIKFGGMPASQQIDKLLHLSDSAGQNNTEYYIWPETAISQLVAEDRIQNDADYRRIVQFLGKYKNASILSGISSYSIYDTLKTPSAYFDDYTGKYIDEFNAAVQIENSAKVQFYHKSKLVPGVEHIPFGSLAFLKPLFAGFGGGGSYGSQDKPSVFYTQSGIGVSPVICYESIWGEWVAKGVESGAQFIAVVTNDAWWGNTSGKDQHFLYARLRAIETRRWVARSANTGISGFINQRGDIVKQSGWWHQAALKEDINLNDDLTFYVKHQDFIALAACILSIAFLILLLLKQFKRF